MRRTKTPFWLITGCMVVALVAGCSSSGASPSSGASASQALTPITVQLDYVPRGNHAMFFAGVAKGIFAKHGLDVTSILPGKGSGTTVQLVGAGTADFGFGDLPTMATGKSQGVPIVALAAVNQNSPLAFCSLQNKHPLTAAKDIEGLRYGITTGGTATFYQTIVSLAKLDRTKITELPVTSPYENYLLQGQVDVIPCYIDAELPTLQADAKDQGPISVLLGADLGYKVFGSGIFTSEKMIKNNPDTVKKFVAAYIEAFQWVIDNQAEACQITAAASDLTKDQAPLFQAQLKEDVDHTFTSDTTKAHGLGYMDPAQWQATVDVLSTAKVLKSSPDPSTLFDNTFVNAANGK